MARFWLDRGVNGFRFDTVNFYFHDKQLRNNPALTAEMRNDSIAPQVNPYNYQRHLYSKNRPENLDFLKRLRSLLDTYDARTSLDAGENLLNFVRQLKDVSICCLFNMSDAVAAVILPGGQCSIASRSDPRNHPGVE